MGPIERRKVRRQRRSDKKSPLYGVDVSGIAPYIEGVEVVVRDDRTGQVLDFFEAREVAQLRAEDDIKEHAQRTGKHEKYVRWQIAGYQEAIYLGRVETNKVVDALPPLSIRSEA